MNICDSLSTYKCLFSGNTLMGHTLSDKIYAEKGPLPPNQVRKTGFEGMINIMKQALIS